jgi:hypothetical protein
LTKYWGLTPYIGFVGIILAVLFLFRKKKNKLRILDIYLISFSPIILLDVLSRGNGNILFLIKCISLLVLVAFYGWFIKIHNKFTTKDGFITVMTILTYTLVSLALSFAAFGIFSQKYLWFNIFLVVSGIFSIAMLVLVQKDVFNKN